MTNREGWLWLGVIALALSAAVVLHARAEEPSGVATPDDLPVISGGWLPPDPMPPEDVDDHGCPDYGGMARWDWDEDERACVMHLTFSGFPPSPFGQPMLFKVRVNDCEAATIVIVPAP